jgi:hypothetical protein
MGGSEFEVKPSKFHIFLFAFDSLKWKSCFTHPSHVEWVKRFTLLKAMSNQ